MVRHNGPRCAIAYSANAHPLEAFLKTSESLALKAERQERRVKCVAALRTDAIFQDLTSKLGGQHGEVTFGAGDLVDPCLASIALTWSTSN